MNQYTISANMYFRQHIHTMIRKSNILTNIEKYRQKYCPINGNFTKKNICNFCTFLWKEDFGVDFFCNKLQQTKAGKEQMNGIKKLMSSKLGHKSFFIISTLFEKLYCTIYHFEQKRIKIKIQKMAKLHNYEIYRF